jgi:hypothetical protein
MSMLRKMRAILSFAVILTLSACANGGLGGMSMDRMEADLRAAQPSLLRYARISQAAYVKPEEDPSCANLTASLQAAALPPMLCHPVPIPGSSHRAAYLIGSDGERQIIAIRGTANTGDALIDLGTQRARDDELEVEVHSGFLRVARAIRNDMRDNNRLSSDQPIVLTGHSLGGAVAVVLGGILVSEQPRLYDVQGIYTYGQPKVFGNDGAVAARDFSRLIMRVVNCGDPVPIVPVSQGWFDHVISLSLFTRYRLTDFQHVGESIVLMPNGRFWMPGPIDFERDLPGPGITTLVDAIRQRHHEHEVSLYAQRIDDLASNAVRARPQAVQPCAEPPRVRVASN